MIICSVHFSSFLISIYVSLRCSDNYLGWRIVATPLLPLGHSSLKYGSSDAGRTVHRDDTAASLMSQAGLHLNIKEHNVGRDIGLCVPLLLAFIFLSLSRSCPDMWPM